MLYNKMFLSRTGHAAQQDTKPCVHASTDSTEAPWPAQLGEDHPLIAAQREDMAAMAITLLEVSSSLRITTRVDPRSIPGFPEATSLGC
jgi:hypothetical protein